MKKEKTKMNEKKAGIIIQKTKGGIPKKMKTVYEVVRIPPEMKERMKSRMLYETMMRKRKEKIAEELGNNRKDNTDYVIERIWNLTKENKISPEMIDEIEYEITTPKSKDLKKELAEVINHERECENRQTNYEGKPVDIAIDYEAWRFDGKYRNQFSKFISISKLESGKRRRLLQLRQEPMVSTSDILKQLLSFAQELYKIKRVFLDQYFFNSEVIKVLQNLHLEYLIPCPGHINSIRKIVDSIAAPCMIKDFVLRDARFNLIITEYPFDRRIIKIAFATNTEINERDLKSIGQIFSYSRNYVDINVCSETVSHSNITVRGLRFIRSTF